MFAHSGDDDEGTPATGVVLDDRTPEADPAAADAAATDEEEVPLSD